MIKEEDVLSITSVRELRELQPDEFSDDRILTERGVRHILELCGAFWEHSGDPKEPHPVLTSGMCSNGFIDTFRALTHANLCQIFAAQLVFLYDERYPDVQPEWVVGSAYAAIDLAKDAANIMGVRHGIPEKEGKKQLWQRLAINPGEVVLQVEELITTLGTTEAVRRGIREGNPTPVTFAPAMLCLIHRSEVTEIEGAPILHLAHFDIWAKPPPECPLCKAGSERQVRPKAHWAELTGRR